MQPDPWAEALSFEGHKPPNDAELIETKKSQKVKGLEFYLYKDEDGNYYYQSNYQMQFEMQMEEAIKRRKKQQKKGK